MNLMTEYDQGLSSLDAAALRLCFGLVQHPNSKIHTATQAVMFRAILLDGVGIRVVPACIGYMFFVFRVLLQAGEFPVLECCKIERRKFRASRKSRVVHDGDMFL